MGCHVELETPPGLKYMNLTYHASGGDENTWLPFTKVRYYTNAFIVKDNKVLFLFSVNLHFSSSRRFYLDTRNGDLGWGSMSFTLYLLSGGLTVQSGITASGAK